jgi:hypothetical protein
MADPTPDTRRKIIELVELDPYLTIRELAARAGTDRDTVKDVLAAHLVATGGSRLPQIRRINNRLAARLNYL